MRIAVERKKVKVLPAEAGWYVLEPITEETDEVIDFARDPILAWVIAVDLPVSDDGAFASSTPVTAAGAPMGDYAIQRPDGTALMPFEFDGTVKQLCAYLTERNMDARARFEKRAKSKAAKPDTLHRLIQGNRPTAAPVAYGDEPQAAADPDAQRPKSH